MPSPGAAAGDPSLNLTHHVILVDGEGQPLDPEKRSTRLGEDAYRGYLELMFQNVKSSGLNKVLLFIHGGLTSHKAAMNHVREWTPQMIADGFYPIFISWNAGFLTNYFEYLFRIRRGEVVNGLWGFLTFPFFLAADLGRGLSRAPISWIDQANTVAATLELYRNPRVTPPSDIPSSIGNERRTIARLFLRGLLLSVSLIGALVILIQTAAALDLPQPFAQDSLVLSLQATRGSWIRRLVALVLYVYGSKLITLPLLVGIGRSTWETMLRRLQTLFRRPREFSAHPPAGFQPPMGGVAVFLDRLSAFAAPAGAPSVTLMGHSMGTIVANEVLRNSPSLRYQNIVYLGAACTIDDFHDAIHHYLRMQPPGTPRPNWFGLSLHPIAERQEWNIFDIAPRGSLLEWIDDLYTTPRTMLDQTLGKWENVHRTTGLFEREVRTCMYLKAFSVGEDPDYPDYNPQKHTEFTMGRFWRESHWHPIRPRSDGTPSPPPGTKP